MHANWACQRSCSCGSLVWRVVPVRRSYRLADRHPGRQWLRLPAWRDRRNAHTPLLTSALPRRHCNRQSAIGTTRRCRAPGGRYEPDWRNAFPVRRTGNRIFDTAMAVDGTCVVEDDQRSLSGCWSQSARPTIWRYRPCCLVGLANTKQPTSGRSKPSVSTLQLTTTLVSPAASRPTRVP